MKITIGIDPGAGGAVVVLHDGKPVAWCLMPTVKVGSNSQVNAAALAAFMFPHWRDAHGYLEKVGPMPGQGVTSMFNFGHSCGVVTGVMVGMGIPHTLVAPATWKKRAKLIGQDKDAARGRAVQLWPWWRELDFKGKGQAFADAALIATFGEPESALKVAPVDRVQRRPVHLV